MDVNHLLLFNIKFGAILFEKSAKKIIIRIKDKIGAVTENRNPISEIPEKAFFVF